MSSVVPDTAALGASVPKKRGRPPKVRASDASAPAASSTPQPGTTTPARKRGRPSKADDATASAGSRSSSKTGTSATPKRLGRPPKDLRPTSPLIARYISTPASSAYYGTSAQSTKRDHAPKKVSTPKGGQADKSIAKIASTLKIDMKDSPKSANSARPAISVRKSRSTTPKSIKKATPKSAKSASSKKTVRRGSTRQPLPDDVGFAFFYPESNTFYALADWQIMKKHHGMQVGDVEPINWEGEPYDAQLFYKGTFAEANRLCDEMEAARLSIHSFKLPNWTLKKAEYLARRDLQRASTTSAIPKTTKTPAQPATPKADSTPSKSSTRTSARRGRADSETAEDKPGPSQRVKTPASSPPKSAPKSILKKTKRDSLRDQPSTSTAAPTAASPKAASPKKTPQPPAKKARREAPSAAAIAGTSSGSPAHAAHAAPVVCAAVKKATDEFDAAQRRVNDLANCLFDREQHAANAKKAAEDAVKEAERKERILAECEADLQKARAELQTKRTLKERAERAEEERLRREEEARQERLRQEEAARQERLRLEEEARRAAIAAEIARRAEEETERQRQHEEQRRRVEEELRRQEQEAAQRAREAAEARLRQQEEDERMVQEEFERNQREAADREAREEVLRAAKELHQREINRLIEEEQERRAAALAAADNAPAVAAAAAPAGDVSVVAVVKIPSSAQLTGNSSSNDDAYLPDL